MSSVGADHELRRGSDVPDATSLPAALANLPERIRIYALAKLLGRRSRDVLDTLAELGINDLMPLSSIDSETAVRVAATLGTANGEPPQRTDGDPSVPVAALSVRRANRASASS